MALEGIVHQVATGPGGLPNFPMDYIVVSVDKVAGDHCKLEEIHGHPDQALCIYSLEDLDKLKQAGFDVFPGALAENVTTKGIDSHDIRVGDIFTFGDVLAQITNYRRPCKTVENAYGSGLNNHLWGRRTKLYDYSSPLWGRTGFYARVLIPGVIRPDDEIIRHEIGPNDCTREYVEHLRRKAQEISAAVHVPSSI